METGKFWVAMLVCLSVGMCVRGNKVIPKETKKEVEEMVKNQPWRCIFHKVQELQFDRVEISSYFVFHFLSLFPQVFQMPFLAFIKVYSSLSALRSLFLFLSLSSLSLSLTLSLSILHRPYMGFSQTKHIKILGSNSLVSTRHKMNSINLRALFAVRNRRHWLKSQTQAYEDIKKIITQISDNCSNLKIKAA